MIFSIYIQYVYTGEIDLSLVQSKLRSELGPEIKAEPVADEDGDHEGSDGEAGSESTGDTQTPPEPNDNFHALIRLYELATKLDDNITANLAVDELLLQCHRLKHVPLDVHARYIWASTQDTDPLRRIMRSLYVYCGSAAMAKHIKKGDWPLEFLRDVAWQHMHMRANGRDVRTFGVEDFFCCQYHRHGAANPKSECKTRCHVRHR